MDTRRATTRLGIEFSLIFLGLPMLLFWQHEVLKRWIIPQLLLIALLCLVVLWRDGGFDRRVMLAFPRHWRACMGRIGLLLLLGGVALLGWAFWSDEVEPFGFVETRPGLWLAVMLLYPVLSALPQEVIFRVFLFHRYRPLFVTPARMIAASALVFALAHLVLGNWQAPLLSLAGGLLFAWTYARTRSLLLVVIEHGLWGDWLFTVGLGRYFYGGHM